MDWVGVLSRLKKVPIAGCDDDLFSDGGVYVVYRGDEVVYVGLTAGPLGRRLRRHCAAGTLLGKQIEAGCAFTVRVIGANSAVDMAELERLLIRELRPSFNTTGVPRARLQGEAAERYCRRQLARQDKVELDTHRDRQAELSVREFKGHYSEVARQALAYIYRAAGSLSLDEELDAVAVGEEAFRLFLEGLM